MYSQFSVLFKNLDVLLAYGSQYFFWFCHHSVYAPKFWS